MIIHTKIYTTDEIFSLRDKHGFAVTQQENTPETVFDLSVISSIPPLGYFKQLKKFVDQYTFSLYL
jgi:hypothetical protein